METKHNLIAWTLECIGTIHYFEDVRLHNELNNSTLKELCKEDLKGIRNDTITKPYNIQDEIVLGAICESDESELLNLFEKKFEKAKNNNGFKTKKAFAKYEYKYQKGIWKNHDITKWIPIAKQWLNLLKGIEAGEPGEVANESKEKASEFTFINNFDKVDPLKVFNYFKINLVDKKYLTIEQLENYLLLAFQDLGLPKEKFSFSNLHIERVRTIFYRYFVEIANKPHGKKEEYAKLLGDYFNSFTTRKVMNNFSDGY